MKEAGNIMFSASFYEIGAKTACLLEITGTACTACVAL